MRRCALLCSFSFLLGCGATTSDPDLTARGGSGGTAGAPTTVAESGASGGVGVGGANCFCGPGIPPTIALDAAAAVTVDDATELNVSLVSGENAVVFAALTVRGAAQYGGVRLPESSAILLKADYHAVLDWAVPLTSELDARVGDIDNGADGVVVVAGDECGASKQDCRLFISTYEPDGAARWSVRFAVQGGARVEAVRALPDATYAIAGRLDGPLDFGGPDLSVAEPTGFTLQLDDAGQVIAWALFPSSNAFSSASSLAAAPEGALYVTGLSAGGIKLDAPGVEPPGDGPIGFSAIVPSSGRSQLLAYSGETLVTALERISNGDVFAGLGSNPGAPANDSWLRRTDLTKPTIDKRSTGDTSSWTTVIDERGVVRALAPDATGGTYVVGALERANATRPFFASYASSGKQLWMRLYDSVLGETTDIAGTVSGTVWIGGTFTGRLSVNDSQLNAPSGGIFLLAYRSSPVVVE